MSSKKPRKEKGERPQGEKGMKIIKAEKEKKRGWDGKGKGYQMGKWSVHKRKRNEKNMQGRKVRFLEGDVSRRSGSKAPGRSTGLAVRGMGRNLVVNPYNLRRNDK